MSRDKNELIGFVEEALPGTFFMVKLENREKPVRCYLSGKMYKNQIKVLVGDKVSAVMAPDNSLGRIVKRLT